MKILENRIRRIVSETLNRFIINETFTNMKQLYHNMPINFLVNMIRVNSFFLQPSNHSGRGGQYYASLTRHKSNIEGFDVLDYASLSEFYISSYATITFNIPKMTRIHGISIRPFDFYGTYSKERTYHAYPDIQGHGHNDDVFGDAVSVGYHDNGVHSKVVYQKLKKAYDSYNGNLSGEEFDSFINDTGDYDDAEYYNMAEENIISDKLKEIPDIFNYIDRIDVYFPAGLSIPDEEDEDYDYDDDAAAYNSYVYAIALCKVACGTSWEKKIVVNLEGNLGDKEISLSEFSKWLKTRKDYNYTKDRATDISSNPPTDREKFSGYYNEGDEEDDDWYDHGHGHWHGHGHGYYNW